MRGSRLFLKLGGAVSALALIGQCAAAAAAEGRFFSVEQRDGAWWFADGDGKPFYSLGVNVVTPGTAKDQYDPQRPQYAAWRHYPHTTAWAEDTTARLRAWNFNTIGGWSDECVTDGRMPSTEVLHLGIEAGAPWNDMFADAFAEEMDRVAKERVAPRREDRQLVGWFTDNELPWYADVLFTFHASQRAASKTRQQLLLILRDHYQDDFAALSRDFAIEGGAASFDELERGGLLKLQPGGRGQTVITRFTEALAERYYSVVCGAIRKYDPHHLILGDRYHGYCPDAVVKAAGNHLDVVTTNYDWPKGVDGYLPNFYLRRLHELSDKPVLVTEYYAAAAENQSGNPNSGELFVVVPTQQQRTEVVQERLKLFADQPFVVGAHWFAFSDEPPHGRPGDGEDYNFGLVDVENRPYETLTDAMKAIHASTPARHAASRQRASGESGASPAGAPRLAARTTLEQVDRSLLSQAALPPQGGTGLADLVVAWDAKFVYLTLAGNHFVGVDHYVTPPTPLSEGLTWTLAVEPIAGGAAADVTAQVDMLGDQAHASGDDVRLVHWQRGVRFGATAAIANPAAHDARWRLGDSIKLYSTLRDRRDGRTTTWRTELQLIEATRTKPTAVELTRGDEQP